MNLYTDADGNKVFLLWQASPGDAPSDYERIVYVYSEIEVDKTYGWWSEHPAPGQIANALFLPHDEFNAKYTLVSTHCLVDIYAILHQGLNKATAHRFAVEIETALTLAKEKSDEKAE